MSYFSRFLYNLEQPIEDKIELIAKEIYGANGIELSTKAREQIVRFKAQVLINHFLIHRIMFYGIYPTGFK
jgi:formyltetrahydrofolate synthetase